MEWKKSGSKQVARVNGYVVEIERSGRYYWGTCYKVIGGAEIKQFTFPPCGKISNLKRLIANNSLFAEKQNTVVAKPVFTENQTLASAKPVYAEVVADDYWWNKY